MKMRISSRDSFSQSSIGKKIIILVVVSALLCAVSNVCAITYVSNQSGDWADEGIWTPTGLPGMFDDVTISAGTIVAAGSRDETKLTAQVVVSTLDVYGTLCPYNPSRGRGSGMTIFARQVRNYGTINGETFDYVGRSYDASSGGIFISLLNESGNPAPMFLNAGMILPGDGSNNGGSFWLDASSLAMVTNTGTIRCRAGRRASGGGVIISGGIVNNGLAGQPGTIRAGDKLMAGGGGHGGDVRLTGSGGGVINTSGSVVRAGDGLIQRDGGRVELISFFWGSTINQNGATIQGGDGCGPGDIRLSGGTFVNNGLLIPGDNICSPVGLDGNVRLDPPEGIFEGGAEVTGGRIEIVGGDLLTIGDLNNPGAIQADEDVVITLAPGGTLDMRNNTAGTNWIIAGNDIIIRADNILLDTDVNLVDIMSAGSGSIVATAGTRDSQLYISPDIDFDMSPGQSFKLEVAIANNGNVSETVDYELTTNGSWVSPNDVNGTWTLEPMDANTIVIDVNVPSDANMGESVTVTIHAATQQTPVAEAIAQITIRIPSYMADFDLDGVVNYNDLKILRDAWLSEEGDGNWNQTADMSWPDYGKIDGVDFAILAASWLKQEESECLCYNFDFDLNGDGLVDLSDVAILTACVSGGDACDEFNCDYNNDESTNQTDLLYLMAIVQSFPGFSGTICEAEAICCDDGEVCE